MYGMQYVLIAMFRVSVRTQKTEYHCKKNDSTVRSVPGEILSKSKK
jgi:hypothetical protein